MSMVLEEMNVLVVDDNPQATKLLTMVLDHIGVRQVLTAANGNKAHEILTTSNDSVNLVICDRRMPGMSGIELLAQTRETHPDMPFVMITGSADAEFIEEAEALGIAGCIPKPFTPQQIEEKVRAIVQMY